LQASVEAKSKQIKKHDSESEEKLLVAVESAHEANAAHSKRIADRQSYIEELEHEIQRRDLRSDLRDVEMQEMQQETQNFHQQVCLLQQKNLRLSEDAEWNSTHIQKLYEDKCVLEVECDTLSQAKDAKLVFENIVDNPEVCGTFEEGASEEENMQGDEEKEPDLEGEVESLQRQCPTRSISTTSRTSEAARRRLNIGSAPFVHGGRTVGSCQGMHPMASKVAKQHSRGEKRCDENPGTAHTSSAAEQRHLDDLIKRLMEKLDSAGVILPENAGHPDAVQGQADKRCRVVWFGPRTLAVKLGARLDDDMDGELLCRVGGGFMNFEEFARNHGAEEARKLVRQHKRGKGVVNHVLKSRAASSRDDAKPRHSSNQG